MGSLGDLIKSGFVIQGSFALPTVGVSDLLYYKEDGEKYLVIGSKGLGSLSVYNVTSRNAVTLSGLVAQTENSGTATLSDLVLVPRGTQDYLLPLGRNDDNFALFGLDGAGALPLEQVLRDDSDLYDRGFTGTAVRRGDTSYFYTTAFGQPGIQVFEIGANNQVNNIQDREDTNWLLLDDITVLHHATLHGRSTILSGGGLISGMHSFFVKGDGSLGIARRVLPSEAEGFRAVTDIDAVQIDDRAFAIVSAAGSDSLSVFRISKNLQIQPIDIERDTQMTRFDNVQAVEVFSTDTRTFVLAGGADDGVSLFELTYRGKLVHLETFGDRFDITLGNVSSIEVRVAGETAYAYVGSSSEGGVTELVIDLSRSGEDIRGGTSKDRLNGTNGDDVIWGMGKSDRLSGGAGDDRLIDGRGRDTLIGGNGADIFEFVSDGRSDFILDFDPGMDRIDLSDTSADHVSDVFVGARKNGIVLKIDDEIIRVRDHNGANLKVSDFTADTFIF